MKFLFFTIVFFLWVVFWGQAVSENRVVAWGLNSDGQCDVPASVTNVLAIATGTGSEHSMALLSDGSVAAWGRDEYGQCDVPASISTSAVAIATGGRHALALVTDSDADGMSDGWEVAYGLDPIVNDASLDKDGDGLTNLQEYNERTFPNNADTDNDGVSDGAEWIAGTILTDAASRFELECKLQPDGSRYLIWEGVSGRYYSFQYCDSLTESWQSYPFEISGSDSFITLLDTCGGGSRFYRVKVRKP